MSLLSVAKEHVSNRKIRHKEITGEHIELALAWATEEISLAQVEWVLYGKSGGMNSYVDLARSLKQAIRLGIMVKK